MYVCMYVYTLNIYVCIHIFNTYICLRMCIIYIQERYQRTSKNLIMSTEEEPLKVLSTEQCFRVTSFCSNKCLIIHQRDEERRKLSYQVLESAVEIFYSSTNTAHQTLQRQHTFKLHYMPTSCPACLSRITLSDF